MILVTIAVKTRWGVTQIVVHAESEDDFLEMMLSRSLKFRRLNTVAYVARRAQKVCVAS